MTTRVSGLMTIKSRGLPKETVSQKWNYWVENTYTINCVPYDWDSIPDDHDGWNDLLDNMARIWKRHHGTNHDCFICNQIKKELYE